MKRSIDSSTLPAPVSLTPEQLAVVASDTSAMLGAGGGMIMIYGGFPAGPFAHLVAPVSVTQVNVASVAARSAAIV
jgi:hypothetical protein